MDTYIQKIEALDAYIQALGRIAVAFSAGVDSTFLLKRAHDLLGDNVIAITACSCAFPKREIEEAKAFCEREGIRHTLFETEEWSIDGFRQNPINRCYLCKKALFEKMQRIAEENDMNCIVEGSNLDDLGDYRPGLAAIEELGIKSPLRQAKLTKADIRRGLSDLGLSAATKPSFACLYTRFVYGETLTKENVRMVELAEQFLLDHGFRQVRVRMHERIARIEVERKEFQKLLYGDLADEIQRYFKKLGFSYATLDLSGYRTGSMNETLK